MAHLPGRYLMGLAVTAMGIQSLMLAIYVGRLQPIPDSVPGHDAIAYFTGAFLLLIGLCILIGKWVRTAAAALAAMLLIWIVVLYGWQALINPNGAWLGTAETLAVFGGAWLLAALAPADDKLSSRLNRLIDSGPHWGRLCVGISLPVFGIAHFVYPDFVASWIPKWIPLPHFWAWFTGAAHFAAGVAILANVFARLAATLAAFMYGSWVLIVHIPRVYAAQHDAFEWNGIFVASALCASALLVAAQLQRR